MARSAVGAVSRDCGEGNKEEGELHVDGVHYLGHFVTVDKTNKQTADLVEQWFVAVVEVIPGCLRCADGLAGQR